MNTSQTKHRKPTVAIGCDPNAATFKDVIISQLKGLGYTVRILEVKILYMPEWHLPLERLLLAHEYDRGILLCGTGIGMSIAANKGTRNICSSLLRHLFSERAIKSNNSIY